MKVLRHETSGFRNLVNGELFPCEGLNVIYGENGQGKTNFIESIWLFTGCHSFRTSRCAELVCRARRDASVSLDFFSGGREQEALVEIGEKKRAQLNGIWLDSPRRLLGEFFAVVFSPASLGIVQNGPAEKRRFMDIAISLAKPAYAVLLSKYMKVLSQRNSLLKQISLGLSGEDTLLAWDEELAKLGGRVAKYRLDYIARLSEISAEVYDGITNGKEKMRVAYLMNGADGGREYEIAEALFNSLQSRRALDIRRLYTSVGPHRDDLELIVNDLFARSYGSQGQQRSCALAMKISEAVILRELTGEQPIALLDDVMSELDAGRQKYLMKYLEEWQVFITCCDPSHLLRLKSGKAFEVKSGEIKEIL